MKIKILNKNIKKITMIIGISLLSLCMLFVVGKTVYIQSHKIEATEYLIEKYGFEEKDLHILNYKGSHFHIVEGGALPLETYRNAETWKYTYEGKTFAVIKLENELYDDYQLEDIFDWSVNYLKAIDENVAGIKIESGFSHELIRETDIENFLIEQINIVIYYHVDDLSKYYYVSKNGWTYLTDDCKQLKEDILEEFSLITKDNNINAPENQKKKCGVSLISKEYKFERKSKNGFTSYYDILPDVYKLEKKGELL